MAKKKLSTKKASSDSSSDQRPYARKKLLINPQFQLRVMGYMIAISLLTLLIVYGSNAYFFWRFEEFGRAMDLPLDHAYYNFISEQKSYMNRNFIFTALGVICAIVAGGLVLSHRGAGPIYRLTTHMKEVAAGKAKGKVTFRKNDFFTDLADAYNDHVKVLKK